MKKITLLLFAATLLLWTGCQQKESQPVAAETPADSLTTLPQSNAPILVLLAHPHLEQSHMNATLAQAAKEVEGVQVVNIYDYPVSVEIYRDAVQRAKALVYEFPFYWMSAPHLLKQWTDEVFTTLAQEGIIEGKEFLVVTTTGSEAAAYTHEGRNLYTMEEYLRPYEGQANHSKMHWNAPLVVYGNPQDKNAAELDLQRGCEAYKARLQQLKEKIAID